MDLGKIIAQLKTELQCLDAVIASMEALARVQDLAGSAPGDVLPSEPPPDEEPLPPKKRRGRPRKEDTPNAAPVANADDAPSPMTEGSEQADDGAPPDNRGSAIAAFSAA
jgi:hypothetical protein